MISGYEMIWIYMGLLCVFLALLLVVVGMMSLRNSSTQKIFVPSRIRRFAESGPWTHNGFRIRRSESSTKQGSMNQGPYNIPKRKGGYDPFSPRLGR
jgi:hypothetical protein